MKDYRYMFALAAIIFAVGSVLRAFQPAYAINGSHISLGSNPIFSAFSNGCSTNEVIASVPSDSVLIITDVVSGHFGDDNITLKTNSGTTLAMFHQEHFMVDTYHSSFRSQTYSITGNVNKITSGIVVPAGEELVVSCSSNKVTVSGYFSLLGATWAKQPF